MNKITKFSFAGERIYCGIDVHKLSWRVNIRSEEFELEDYSQQSGEAELLSHLQKNIPGLNMNWFMRQASMALAYTEVYKVK
jgi:transposase